VILVAAFEPFAGRRRNRARDAAARLAGQSIAGVPVELTALPTAFAPLPQAIATLVARRPTLLLLVGESNAARTLLVERFALNLAHGRVADNQGAQPRDAELQPGGEAARRVAFDARAASDAAVAAGVPCDVSAHAGTFCCNAALYYALAPGEAAGPLVAFVHVPARWPWARDARAARGLAAIAAHLVDRR
jgi:pyroglutamyl-peptidase